MHKGLIIGSHCIPVRPSKSKGLTHLPKRVDPFAQKGRPSDFWAVCTLCATNRQAEQSGAKIAKKSAYL